MNSTLDRFCDQAAADLAQRIGGVAGGDHVTLAGYCSQPNVGDNAIARAQDRLLKRAGVKARRVPDRGSSRDLRGPVLLSGGGNIGDLYPWELEQRVEILEADTKRPVLQLPQSIFFREERNADRLKRAVAAHRDFTLLVRDNASLAWANDNLECPSQLVPDCAFALGPLRRPAASSRRTLVLARTDDERASEPPDVETVDWLAEPRTRHAPELWPRWLRTKCRANGVVDDWLLRRLAAARLDRGLRLLSSAEVVVTDRLHAVILCVLLGVPVVAVDNSYGKVFGVMTTWQLDDMATVYRARDMIEGTDLARSVGAEPRTP